jgi:Mg-chelatase subunit ChlD
MGKFKEAEVKLRDAVKQDSASKAGHYYLDLATEARIVGEARKRGIGDNLVRYAPRTSVNSGISASKPSSTLANADYAPLEIKLPVPAFMGTPTDLPMGVEAQPPTGQLAQVVTEPQQAVPAVTNSLVASLPETSTAENPISTFSLNVSDVSFKVAAASLDQGAMPDPQGIREEEFINAFDYRDPAPAPGEKLAFAWERARFPYAHNRDIVRFSVKTASQGREAGKPLCLVVLLDNSGSMERPDRVKISHDAMRELVRQLKPQDRISLVVFARTARLVAKHLEGGAANVLLTEIGLLNPEGGTNLEEAMDLAYETAVEQFMPNANNRVILLTDGAANLGNVNPEDLKQKVVEHRLKGIATDCFGIGWEDYNDDLLEVLSRNGDGRYSFLNDPEVAGAEFASRLAGALNVAASDVKTQVEFNPKRVTTYRQIGYAKHQLTKEQFRDNTVDAAEIAAAEAGNALYVIQVNPEGQGPIGVVRVRFKDPATGEYREQEWPLSYQPKVAALDQAGPAMKLAVSAASFAEWLARSPYASEVNLSRLLAHVNEAVEVFDVDPRPQKLAEMIRQAQVLGGK